LILPIGTSDGLVSLDMPTALKHFARPVDLTCVSVIFNNSTVLLSIYPSYPPSSFAVAMNHKTSTLCGLALIALLGGCASKPPLAPVAAVTPAPTAAPAQSSSAQSAVAAVQAPVVNTTAPGPDVPKQVYFAFNSAALKAQYKPVVEVNAQFLQSHPAAHLQLQGNCDPRGSQEYNLALGQSRANAVMKAMTLLGASPNQMEAISYGSEKASPARADYAHDRRVDLAYQQ
jgi:peptidoglycan-associated lipoprotein